MKSAKILLIDRDPVLVSDITAMLKKAGYYVSSTDNKDEALTIVGDEKPDLGIFEASGNASCCIDIATELYQNHDIPFIVLSDTQEGQTINKAVLSGALSYLRMISDIIGLK